MLGMRSFGQQNWNDMISYLSECQNLRSRCGLFGCMRNYFPSKIFHKKNGILNGKLAFANRDLA